jgi:hypothetical protein
MKFDLLAGPFKVKTNAGSVFLGGTTNARKAIVAAAHCPPLPTACELTAVARAASLPATAAIR